MCYSFPFFFHKPILNLGAFSIFPPDSIKGSAVPLLPGCIKMNRHPGTCISLIGTSNRVQGTIFHKKKIDIVCVNLDLKFRYARQEILQSGVAPPPLHFQQEQRPRKGRGKKGRLETC
ncbi:hypothetical protein ES288_D09G113000v1 [Gossypium darwinii]|uniref:Uncharacterized protein n=1 Tax=Gossypium darwinii TaxID=34276 RepID=A0A5D2BBK5_GOSDA|nr:hypothetical protein ES288_D09G113000v1 [Gossypium darwinii]